MAELLQDPVGKLHVERAAAVVLARKENEARVALEKEVMRLRKLLPSADD